MYKVSDEYGTTLPLEFDSYDLACRFAHYERELGFSVGVVSAETGRYVSEVFYADPLLDLRARRLARRVFSMDYESLICMDVRIPVTVDNINQVLV